MFRCGLPVDWNCGVESSLRREGRWAIRPSQADVMFPRHGHKAEGEQSPPATADDEGANFRLCVCVCGWRDCPRKKRNADNGGIFHRDNHAESAPGGPFPRGMPGICLGRNKTRSHTHTQRHRQIPWYQKRQPRSESLSAAAVLRPRPRHRREEFGPPPTKTHSRNLFTVRATKERRQQQQPSSCSFSWQS